MKVLIAGLAVGAALIGALWPVPVKPESLQLRARVQRGPEDHINTGILQLMVSGIPLVLGLGM